MKHGFAFTLLLVAGCSPHSTPSARNSSSQVSARAAPLSGARRPIEGVNSPPPTSPDLAKKVMGWLVVADGAPLLRAMARVGRGAATSDASDAAVKVLLAQLVGVDVHVTSAIALGKPSAIAVLHPASVQGVRPVLALLPIGSRADVERSLERSQVAFRRLPWGISLDDNGATAFIWFRDNGYAAIAPREDLVEAAAKLLAEPIARKAEAPMVAHLDLTNVYGAYGRQLDDAVTHFLDAIAERDDPQLSYAMREARRLVRFADSMKAIDLLVGSDDEGVTVVARADGSPDGEWAQQVAGQRAGEPAWGAKLLPRDAVLVYLTNRSSQAMLEDLDASVQYLGDASSPQVSAGVRASWRGALGRATEETTGEVAYAVWPGSDGGVGLGGAWRVHGGGAARRQTLAAYELIGPHLGAVVARALRLDPKRFHLDVAVRAVTVIGKGATSLPVDRIIVSVRWPKGASTERRAFEQLFGHELVMATAYLGDTALFTVGRDWKSRLATMLRAARGEAVPSAADDPGLHAALEDHKEHRVSMTFLPMPAMAKFLGNVAREGSTLDAAALAELEPMLASAGNGAIVSTTHAHDGRWEVTSRLPASALPGMKRVGTALWKIALSPLLNPPQIPPLPIPPSHVTPKL